MTFVYSKSPLQKLAVLAKSLDLLIAAQELTPKVSYIPSVIIQWLTSEISLFMSQALIMELITLNGNGMQLMEVFGTTVLNYRLPPLTVR
jgi:hypothetical protein